MEALENMTPASSFYRHAHRGESHNSKRFFDEPGGEFFPCFAPMIVQLLPAPVAR